MYQKIAEAVLNRRRIKLGVILEGEQAGKQLVYNDSDREWIACQVEDGSLIQEVMTVSGSGISHAKDPEVFTEVFTSEPELVILGGGHVAVPVCRLAKMTGFQVTIIEDREEMVTKERFPDADRLICTDFENLTPFLEKQGDNSFYVIVTRGHQYDQICLEQVLRQEYAYLGVIGSRRKVAHCQELLKQHGFRNAEIASVHMPIGLNIGAQSPEEIAVSIIAEIIQEKNRKHSDSSPLAMWQWIKDHPGERAVLVTIIEKKGSAPRGAGSRMLCLFDGTIIGTIGGGILEYKAAQEAVTMKPGETRVRWFDLSNREGAELGMVCGGKVRVLMQEIEL